MRFKSSNGKVCKMMTSHFRTLLEQELNLFLKRKPPNGLSYCIIPFISAYCLDKDLQGPAVIKGKLLLSGYEQLWVVQYGEIGS